MGRIVAVCVSDRKGTQKDDVGEATIKENHGLVGDAHSGDWHRQVSLVAKESIDKSGLRVKFGDFGENLTTEGIELTSLPVGTKLSVGDVVVLEVSQIGKKCDRPCSIYYKTGECIMPKEGIFARVLKGGTVKVGDRIESIL